MAAAVLAVAAPVMGLPDPTGVAASAAETKLLTVTQEELFGKAEKFGLVALDDGYYLLLDSQKAKKVVKFDSTDLENWRKNGKPECKAVECDVDLSGMNYMTCNGSYVKFEKDGVIHTFMVDKAANKLKEVYSYEGRILYNRVMDEVCRDDGYSCVERTSLSASKDGKVKFSIYTPDGKKIDKEVAVRGFSAEKGEDYLSDNMFVSNSIFTCASGDYLGYVCVPDLSAKKTVTTDSGREYSTWEHEISGINKDGSLVMLKKTILVTNGFGGFPYYYGANYISWKEYDGCNYVMTLDDGKTYKIDGGRLPIEVCDVVGTKAIIQTLSARVSDITYNMVDLKTGKILTEEVHGNREVTDGNVYYERVITSLSTSDGGETFLAATVLSHGDDAACHFLDSNGAVLGTFDDASDFDGNGMYAPVVKDGKGYLVDKKMNKVSDELDATGCVTMSEEFFCFITADGKYVFATSAESGVSDTVAIKTGDADGDGKIKLNDATTVLAHIVGNKTLTGNAFKNADLDNDGKVSINDAILLLKLIVNS